MSVFKIVGERIEDHAQKVFWFDNLTGKITEEKPDDSLAIEPVAIDAPGRRSGPFGVIRIQLGLSCNYDCSYCLQKTSAHSDETTPKDIDAFLAMFDKLPKQERLRVEFWGGEPFVYWKTLKPLAEALRKRHLNAEFFTVTNGSLLTHEIVDWLADMGFRLAISHDGPGQHLRKDDPLVDNAEAIAYAVARLGGAGRFSISSMLNSHNHSRLAIIDFFAQRFPDQFIPASEMGFVDVYDANDNESLQFSRDDYFQQRRSMWWELRSDERVRQHCFGQSQAIESLVTANRDTNRPYQQPGTKCGMDSAHKIALDLRGNVITCQNVSAAAIAPNGKSHNIGHVSDLAGVVLDTSTHWTDRKDCSSCPVLRLCGGSCMFIQGDSFKISCDASYTDKVTQLAIAFEQVTGYVPVLISGEGFDVAPERADVFGDMLKHEPVKPALRVIPITPIKG